jgi:ABC-2 type transport system ATP-binding protein
VVETVLADPAHASYPPADQAPALDVRHVVKEFGPSAFRRWLTRSHKPAYRAVDDVSFRVERGEIFGVIGANGSGKSTLIRIISTLLLADSGEVRVFGFDPSTQALEVRRRINRVSADPSFFRPMSAMENLLFFGRAYGLPGEQTKTESLAILDALGLDERRAREPMLRMSRGQQQKVAVARAFLTKPQLLLLDEPTTGLDPRSKRDVQQFVATMRRERGCTILLTTHDMEEAELLCDRLTFLSEGRIVAAGTPLELRERVAAGRPIDEVDMEDVFMALTGRRLDDDEEGNPDDNG